jgi:hypothetical protein
MEAGFLPRVTFASKSAKHYSVCIRDNIIGPRKVSVVSDSAKLFLLLRIGCRPSTSYLVILLTDRYPASLHE